MAAKLKVQDVLSDGKRVGLVGNGKTPHVLRDDTPTPAAQCNGKAATEADNLAGELNICNNCAKVYSNNDTKESDTMAETTKTEGEIAAEVKADVEKIIETIGGLNKTEGEKIDSLNKQAEDELLKVSANKRAGLRMQLKAAIAEAKDRKPGTALVLKPETKEVSEIAGYSEIVTNAANIVAEGIKGQVSAHESARKVAEAILDGRLRVINKQGKPDLKGDRKASKDLAKAIYDEAAAKLHAEQWGADASVDYETLEKQLKDKVQYQMTAVLPAFIYSLDNSPEQFAELFPAEAAALAEVKENDPESETKPSDLIFDLYGVNRKSKAELAAERRAKAKELEAAKGDADAEGAEGEGEGDEDSEDTEGAEKSPVLKLAESLGKNAKALDKLKVTELSKDEIAALRDQLMALNTVTQKIAMALVAAGQTPEADSE